MCAQRNLQQSFKQRSTPLIYPFAIAAFPVLNLLAYNIAEVNWLVVLRPLAYALAGAAALLGLMRLVLRDWEPAGLVTALLLLIFASYGHVYAALSRLTIQGIILGRHRYLVVIYAIVVIVGLLWIIRHARQLSAHTYLFNVMGFVLIALPGLQIASHLVKSSVLTLETRQQYQGSDAQVANLTISETLPDIYYIILDSHTRSDALQDDFNYDNSLTMDMLRNAGFYVADCSRSNYRYTLGSLTSALNMEYLDTLLAEANNTPVEMENTWVMLKQSRIRHWLEAVGYKTVAFDTTYDWSRLSDAAIYLRLGSDAEILQGLTPFETMLIKSTAGLILADSQSRLLSSQFEQINFPYSYFMSSQRFILSLLEDVSIGPDHQVIPETSPACLGR